MPEELTLTKNQDGEFYVFEDDLYITSALKEGKRWEPHVLNFLEKYVASDSIILDAGAHIGTHTVFFGKRAPSGVVYAFEPMPAIFRVLALNVEHNELANVRCFNMALSNQKQVIRLPNSLGYVPKDETGKSNLGGVRIDIDRNDVTLEVEVSVGTIDSLNLERLDILKLDVETYEKQVILGGEKTIDQFKPLIVFEAQSQEALQEISSILKNFGYSDIAIIDPYYSMDYYASAT